MQLNSLERDLRRQARVTSRQAFEPSFLGAFLLVFVAFPFQVAGVLFVPFVGQLLGVISLLLSVFYLFETRSVSTLMCGLVASGCSIGALAAVGSYQNWTGLTVAYFTLGLSMAMMIGYILIVASALFRFYEKGYGKQIRSEGIQ